MRVFAILLLLAAGPVLVAQVPPAAALTAPSEQELLVKKKKKAEEARRAASAKKAKEAERKAAARKLEAKKRLADATRRARTLQERRKAESRASAAARQTSQSRDCKDFLACLFGSKPRSGVQRASTGRQSRDMATAEVVDWAPSAKYQPGSIVVRTPERALYLVLGDGSARRYKVGVGREGFQWSGNGRIVDKREWPTWRPPQVMIDREAAKGHKLPAMMEGGPDNPLGARALYIGGTIFRIHGTNNAASIGGAVSSGCIRMMNTDVVDLYDRVRVGAKVYVYQ